MTNSLFFSRALAAIIQEQTGINTYSDFDIETINGSFNKVLLLHLNNSSEVLQTNNTQRLDYTITLVLAPETVSTDEEHEIQEKLYNAVSSYFSNEALKYTELGGAVILQYISGQYAVALDGAKTNFAFDFSIIAQF